MSLSINNYHMNNTHTHHHHIQIEKPFYLYKGLNPEREESFKIYPNIDNNNNNTTINHSNYKPLTLPSISLPLQFVNHNNNVINNNIPKLDITSTEMRNSLSSSNTSSTFTTPLSTDNEIENENELIDNNDNYLSQDNSINSDNESIKCHYQGCRYKGTFLSKDYLRRHIREQHKRSREHICSGYNENGIKWGCNKTFSRPYQLVNHWRGQRSLKRCSVPVMKLKKAGVL